MSIFRRQKGGTPEEDWEPPAHARALMELAGIGEAGSPEDVRLALWEVARPRPSGASPRDLVAARKASTVPDAKEPARMAPGAAYGPREAPREGTPDPWALLRDRKLKERDERRREGRFGELGIFR